MAGRYGLSQVILRAQPEQLPASITAGTLRHVANPKVLPPGPWPASCEQILGLAEARAAAAELMQWPRYEATPLLELPAVSAAAGVAKLLYKDEAARFGLGSFKALGGAYALWKLLERLIAARTPDERVTFKDITGGRWAQFTRNITVATATDGNHGRSVAWGAQLTGCRSVIFIHADVSKGRERALVELGAQVVRIDGNYDDSVRIAQQTADREGWYVVSDTSYPGYTQIPRDVMAGYTVMVEEVISSLRPGTLPTHVFVQGGVGALAASVVARLWQHFAANRPRITVVEPLRAACLLESARAGRPTAVKGKLDTAMAGLAAGEPSMLAWPLLEAGVSDFLAITDEAALEVMRLLGEWRSVGAGAGGRRICNRRRRGPIADRDSRRPAQCARNPARQCRPLLRHRRGDRPGDLRKHHPPAHRDG